MAPPEVGESVTCPIQNPTCHRESEAKCPTMDEHGDALCTLGVTDFPVKAGDAFVEYKLKYTADGHAHLRMSQTHIKYVRLLAERGGEIQFDYGLVEHDVREHLKRLVEMGVITSVPIIGSESRKLDRLTDMGRNLATSIITKGA